MPSQRKSKEDTWTTAELTDALKPEDRRRHRDRDEERKKDHINGDDRHKRRKDEDSERRRHRDEDDSRRKHRDSDRKSRNKEEVEAPPSVDLTEDERERLRRERREKREKKDSTTSSRSSKKEIPYRSHGGDKADLIDVSHDAEDNDRRGSHRSDRDRRHRDRDDRDRRRHHEDEDDDEAEREKLRRERRERREKKVDIPDDDRRRRHEEKRDRRKDEDRERRRDKDERRDRHDREDREKRLRDKDREKDRERGKDRERHRDKDKDREREERKEQEREREREERRREREERKKGNRHEEKPKKEEKKNDEEDEYNYEDEEFEDYDDDFEDDDGDDDDDNDEEERSAVKGSIHKTGNREGTALEYSDSEVNDVLRALDEENDRLVADSKQGRTWDTHRSYDRHSDEEDDDDDEYRGQRTIQPGQQRPRTAINFVSAKQRAMNRRTANKTMQRGHDLLQMLELDVARFDLLDLAPVKEYDLYIRSFGRTDTRQAYVQTNDDNVDRDIQTEEIDQRSKWTQHPPEDFKGVGRGDGEKDYDDEEDYQLKQIKTQSQDPAQLSNFIEKAGQVISILLEESRTGDNGQESKSRSHINMSEGYTQINPLPVLEGRFVEFATFSPTQPNMCLTVYSKPQTISEENPVSRRGVICVWNTREPSFPYRLLACNSQPRCCCFSPVSPHLVFAGMADGSVAMWDLREPLSMHRATVALNEEYILRYPTYDTAGVLENDNHHSPVVSIQPIYSYDNESSKSKTQLSEDTSSGLSFQLVTTEDAGVLNFWVVAEIQTPDVAGSETDLGLAPGAKVKLLKSSTITLENPSRDLRLKTTLRAIDLKIMPSDPNQFYVGTDSGFILHGVRFGSRTFPRAHSPDISSIVDISSIDFSPFKQPCFLAGSSDGSFALYHTKSESPLVVWPYITKGRSIQCVRWSPSRPCIFYILDSASTMYTFDILEGDAAPKTVEQISKQRVVSFALTTDHQSSGLGLAGRPPQMLVGLESGVTEIHTISRELREQQELELEYLISYLERF